MVVAEVLLGLQQRRRAERVKTKEADLQRLCSQLRQQQVATLADFLMADDPDGIYRALCNAVTAHARRALAGPETEIVNDEWDLVVFGHAGTLSSSAITQPWLRAVAKRWAAEDCPSVGLPPPRSAWPSVTTWLRRSALRKPADAARPRADPRRAGQDRHGSLPQPARQPAVGRAISGDARIGACREVRKVLTTARAVGLTRPGGPVAGLGEDFTIGVADVPASPNRPSPTATSRPRSCDSCAHTFPS